MRRRTAARARRAPRSTVRTGASQPRSAVWHAGRAAACSARSSRRSPRSLRSRTRDLTEQEHRSLHRLQALEEYQERHRQRVGHLRLLRHVVLRSGHERLGEPRADVGLTPGLRAAEVVDRESRHRGRQVALRGVDLGALLGRAAPPEERVLHHVLGLRDAPEHPIRDREQQGPQVDEFLIGSNHAGSVPRHAAHETRDRSIP